MKLSVIGAGYLGSVHAVCMASIGHEVVVVDVDRRKIDLLSSGISPFYESKLEDMLKECLDEGSIIFTTDYSKVSDCDAHFVCVGTPQREDSNSANTDYVYKSVDSLLRYVKFGSLIIGKSTVPVGTSSNILSIASSAGVDVAWNPEFLREGTSVDDTLKPDRIVVGVNSHEAKKTLTEIYKKIIDSGVPFIVTDLATAEMIKLSSNSFLATKISFINSMSEICDKTGADVLALSEALGLDPRIGKSFLKPGLGFGGSCLSKDIRAFLSMAEEVGSKESLLFLNEVDKINLRARQRTIDLVKKMIGNDLSGKNITVWGLSFKPESDDLRDSASLFVALELEKNGANVTIHDPVALKNAKEIYTEFNYCDSIINSAINSDAILLLTEWKNYLSVDPSELNELVNNKIIIDARNFLDYNKWISSGWNYKALGRPNL